MTQFFTLERGVRQGCPLSVYLFLLVVELLAIKIRNNKDINGVQLKNTNLKISQMADDTCLFLRDNYSISVALQILTDFAVVSGLKTNVEKTKAYNVGKKRDSIIEKDFNVQWDKNDMSLLGLTITSDPDIHIRDNIDPKIELMINLFKVWSRRSLTLKGKITIIKSLIISLFVYPASIMSIPDSLLELIKQKIYKFLRNGKKPKIA